MAPNPKDELTEREKQIMALAWLCFNEKPKPDIKKLAGLAGFTNHVSASNAWAKIQKKIVAQAGDDSKTPEAQTPKTPASKKRDRKGVDKDNEDDEEVETPVKKAKTPRKAATKVKAEPVEEDGIASAASEAEEGGEAIV